MKKTIKHIIGLHLGINRFYSNTTDSPSIVVTSILFSLYFLQVAWIIILCTELFFNMDLVSPLLLNKKSVLLFMLLFSIIFFKLIEYALDANLNIYEEIKINEKDLLFYENLFRIIFFILLFFNVILILIK